VGWDCLLEISLESLRCAGQNLGVRISKSAAVRSWVSRRRNSGSIPRIKKKKPPSLEETRFGNSGFSKEGPEVVRSSTTTAFSITADPVREGGSRRFAGFDERPCAFGWRL